MKTTVVCLALIIAILAFGDELSLAQMPIRVREGFQVELVYQIPRESEGSWVAMAVDPRGRLVASDQTGSLYRIDPNGEGPVRAERIKLSIGRAHGLAFAFDSLYAVVAERTEQGATSHGPGLYRIQDTDGDDLFDSIELLQSFNGSGEHGPHSVVLSPDGERLFVIAGNKTQVPDAAKENSLVPLHWGEDDLLPRLWGPIGSEVGTPAPGGWIASTDRDGQQWQLHAVGLRNGFDLAFDRNGDMFTVDADAEFDLGTPWYQPTRVFHVIAGTDYGWRSGAGKWQAYYADTLPPVVELGQGSPTGLTFAQGAAFPRRYRGALFVGDWARGRIVAVHLEPDGSSYRGTFEDIVSGTPLPVTDLLVHPQDGSIYFTVGGRQAASALYRLSWRGDEVEQSEQPLLQHPEKDNAVNSRATLRRLGLLQLDQQRTTIDHQKTISDVWSFLAHPDRTIRHSARILLEHVPCEFWQEKALNEGVPMARMNALLALARSGDSLLLPEVIESLTTITWNTLTQNQQLTLLRCFELAFTRMSRHPPDRESQHRAMAYLEREFPVGSHAIDVELCRLLIYLDSPRVPELAIMKIGDAVTREQRLAYVVPLRHQKSGWTNTMRTQYFSQLGDAATWRSGLSLAPYIQLTAADALSHVPSNQRERYADLLKPELLPVETAASARAMVREWSLNDFSKLGTELPLGADPSAGRKLFAEAQCFSCHRFRGEGGAVGPDLTTVARRLSTRDMLEAIVDPSRVISDQFAATTLLTIDGRVVNGRIVNLQKGALLIQTDMLDPANLQRVETQDIQRMQPAKTSMMPTGLLNTLTFEEITDLLAFLKTTN